jgi:hypothetical protein
MSSTLVLNPSAASLHLHSSFSSFHFFSSCSLLRSSSFFAVFIEKAPLRPAITRESRPKSRPQPGIAAASPYCAAPPCLVAAGLKIPLRSAITAVAAAFNNIGAVMEHLHHQIQIIGERHPQVGQIMKDVNVTVKALQLIHLKYVEDKLSNQGKTPKRNN